MSKTIIAKGEPSFRTATTRRVTHMTHDQSDRYAIVPIALGPVPKEAIVVGNIDQVFEYIPQSVARDDAMKELEAERHLAHPVVVNPVFVA